MRTVRATVCTLVALAVCSAVSAQTARVALNIKEQPMRAALKELGDRTGLQILYRVEDVAEKGVLAPKVAGDLSAKEALEKLLVGSGLTYEFVNDKTVRIVAASPAGAMNGTESIQQPEEVVVRGTYTYAGTATVGGKTVQSLREIPQSISIITRQRLDDQNINTLPEALKFTTGMTAFRGDGVGNFNSYYARGYPADSFLLDGLNMGRVVNMIEQDLAVFDRIEVLRGPAGLFQGAGEPGVTISLARKRALAPAHVKTVLGTGSWNAYRGEVDATGALSASGSLRGRVVGVYDDRDSYLKGAGTRKRLIYGTSELDLSDRTTLAFGGTYQDVQAVINQGLPAFPDGRLLDVPRSTSIAADWNKQDMQTTDVFAEVESHFGERGLLKVALGREIRHMNYKSARANGLVDATGLVNLQLLAYGIEQTDTTADVFLSTPFTLGGRSHNFLIGADYRTFTNSAELFAGPGTQGNVYSFNRNIPYPVFEEDLSSRIRTDSEGYGVYSQFRIQATPRVKALIGGRLSWARSDISERATGIELERAVANSELTPYGGLIVDISPELALYASYSSIFKPQSGRTFAGGHIEPRTGNQYEAGLKGEFRGGQLNAHAAVFRLTDENRALDDPEHEGFVMPTGRVRSEGAEAEISGKLTAGWSISAGYAYNKSKYLRAPDGQVGQQYSTFTPKHNGSLWTHYLVQGDLLRGLEIGIGARAVSEFYSLRGVRFVGDPYAIVSAQLGYAFYGRHKLTLNFENLLDKRYYEQVNYAGRQNFYGAPRSIALTLRSQF